MLQCPNLLPSTFSAYHHLSFLSMINYSLEGQLNNPHSYVRAKMFDKKEETERAAKSQLVG